MPKDIKIVKGLNIKVKGSAEHNVTPESLSSVYAIIPDDFHGITPKLKVKVGDKVLAGQVVFYNKAQPDMNFVAPVSGEIIEIQRGERRKIEVIKILSDLEQENHINPIRDLNEMSDVEVKKLLLESGVWAFIKQRPYDIIANPKETPKAIFISAYDSAPLGIDYDFVLQGKEKKIKKGIAVLKRLTQGKIHVTTSPVDKLFSSIEGVVCHKAYGPHPVGNVGVQINKIDPINKGERVWTIKPQDLIIIGDLFLTGKFNAERILAVTGPEIKKPHYIRTIIGSPIRDIVKDNLKNNSVNKRFISGNILTGKQVSFEDGYLGYCDNQVCVIAEGNDYRFMGWTLPQTNNYSFYRAGMFSWLTPNKQYALSANQHGEERAFVLTGFYERIFPFDIYPMQLLKAAMIQDIDAMEQLGIYEVAPEDFALTEFICVSKINHQQIIRAALDLMVKEVG